MLCDIILKSLQSNHLLILDLFIERFPQFVLVSCLFSNMRTVFVIVKNDSS